MTAASLFAAVAALSIAANLLFLWHLFCQGRKGKTPTATRFVESLDRESAMGSIHEALGHLDDAIWSLQKASSKERKAP